MENTEKQLFLREFKRIGDVKRTCKLIGVPRSTFYYVSNKDPVFAGKVRRIKADLILRFPSGRVPSPRALAISGA